MKILIFGSGNMVKAMSKECNTQKVSSKEIIVVENSGQLCDSQTVAVYFGEGDQLDSVMSVCAEKMIPLIQGSSTEKSLDTMNDWANREVRAVYAPFLSPLSLKLVMNISDILQELRKVSAMSIAESYPGDKGIEIAGVTRALAEVSEFDPDKVSSVTDPVIQKVFLGVPGRFVGSHEYATASFEAPGECVSISIGLRGCEATARGAVILARSLNNNPTVLKSGITSIFELPSYMFSVQ